MGYNRLLFTPIAINKTPTNVRSSSSRISRRWAGGGTAQAVLKLRLVVSVTLLRCSAAQC